MNFPLYDNLEQDITEKDLLVKQKTELVKSVKTMSLNDMELFYALIRVYEKKHSDEELDTSIPFEGEKIDASIKFNLENFPNKLKQILYKFTSPHNKQIEEEQVFNAQREP